MAEHFRESVIAEDRKETERAAEKKHMRSAYVWNTAGTMINAFQSVMILAVLTRVCDLTTAGIFTLAYANGNLFHFVGLFGMRNYEASDVRPQFGFRAYLRSRIITSIAMVVCSWGYLAYSAVTLGYQDEKIWAIAIMAVFKVLDVVEDVFDGNYQQQGRLDIAGKQMTLRVVVGILSLCITVAITKNLVLAIGVATVCSATVLTLNLVRVKVKYNLPAWHLEAPSQNPIPLMIECLAPFVSSFLLFYISNASKWAIDAVMNDVAQAQYGFIAMPVFVVNLLSEFIYMPIIRPLSGMWEEGDHVGFRRMFVRQIVIILGVTVACILGAFILGVPVLSMLYNTDLSDFRLHLCALLIGGGLYAFARLFYMGVIVMRQQKKLVWGYIVTTIIAVLGTTPIVSSWGINGAVCSYIACMAILATWTTGLFWYFAR